MSLKPRPKFNRWCLLVALAAAGCHEYVNPWTDEYFGPEDVTTASVEGIRNQPTTPVPRTRGFATTVTAPQDGTVGHFPLWWEDPFEDRGSEDHRFAWTWEDYFALPYGLSRYIVNFIGVPLSAVVQPPVPLMGSDGVTHRALGEQSDPQWHPAGASPTPPDILDIGVVPDGERDGGA